MGGIFESKKRTPEVEVIADPFKNVREPFIDFINKNLGQAGPEFTGERVAPLTPEEQATQGFLRQFQAQGPSKTRQAVTGEIQRTLGADLSDPSASPFFQATKAVAEQNLRDLQKNIASNEAAGGRFFTGARFAEQNKAATTSSLALNELAARIAESERDRQLGILPLGLEAARFEEEDPLRKTAAGIEFGGLPRQIEQAKADAKFADFIRRFQSFPLDIAQLASGSAQAPIYGEVGFEESPFSKFASFAAPIAGTLLGGPIGGALGAGAAGLFSSLTKKK